MISIFNQQIISRAFLQKKNLNGLIISIDNNAYQTLKKPSIKDH